MSITKTIPAQCLKDFRFWVFLFFLLRLIHITDAPTEATHSWRQCFTNDVARNQLEIEPSLIYPRISTTGNDADIIASEFPIFNYLIYIPAKISGFQHWYGRLINLIFSSFGIYFFYLIIRNFSSEKTAFNSGIILLSSIWLIFSRKIMPDTFSVSLVIIGCYFALKFLERKKYFYLYLFFFFAALGVLSKLPAIIVLTILLLPLTDIKIKLKFRMILGFVVCLSIIPALVWYFYWVPHLIELYNNKLFFPKGIIEGWTEIYPYLDHFFEKFYFASFYSYLCFVIFIIGISIFIKEQSIRLISIAVCIFLVFLVFSLKTGAVFPMHNYYIIPFVPFMAAMAGYGLSKFPSKIIVFILCFIVTEGILNQQHDLFNTQSHLSYLENLENDINEYVEVNDLILTNGGDNPQLIYFAHRKGWNLSDTEVYNSLVIQQYKLKGAKWLIYVKNKNLAPPSFENIKIENENYILVQL